MKHATHRVLTAGLVAALLGVASVGQAAEPKAGGDAAKTVEEMLKAAKLDYAKVGDSAFKVPITDNEGNTTVIIVQAGEIDLNGAKGYASVWSIVAHVDGDKMPDALLVKMTQFNSTLKFGTVSAEKDKGGGNTVYLGFSFFLKNAESDTMIDYMKMCYGIRQLVRKDLQRVIEEGGAEK